MSTSGNNDINRKSNPIDILAEQSRKKYTNPKKNKILKQKGLKKDLRASELKIFGSDYFFNYELSWLKFNRRVLEEALNPSNPLLERVKFIGIVCSNLDEFFQKRVGGLKRQIDAGVQELSVDGRSPEEQLREIREVVLKMIGDYRDCFFSDLVPDLAQNGIQIKKYGQLNPDQKKRADEYFDNLLYPIITPLAVDESHPFPFISNQSRSFAIQLTDPADNVELFARIKIPANRPRWISVETDKIILVSVSDIIRAKMDVLFPGLEIKSAHIFRLTRNADLERNEEEADDLLEMIEDELRERRFSEVVRLELDKAMPDSIKEYLIRNLKVQEDDVIEMEGPIGLADCIQLYDLEGFERLKFDSWIPVLHPLFRHELDEPAPDSFSVIRKGDFLVHHPYHSFETSTQKFIEDAASDPNVLAIKQTLYRTSSDSQVMHALIRAAEAGKQVAVLIELKARFDEERNISWAQKLEKAGVHVSYGLPGLKIHSKLTIVIREEGDELRRYVHIGTGNYHPDTAQVYEDLGFFTVDKETGEDVSDLFNLFTGYARIEKYKKLIVAPKFMREEMMARIEREIKESKAGRPAKIIAKMNNLEDPLIIQKLYEASNAGVKMKFMVRSVCRLIPGVNGMSENIEVYAIVGRFLEHSRCFYFYSGGNHEFFIGSADWMHRNLDARVEVLVPITDPGLKEYLHFLFDVQFRDNKQRWKLMPDGKYIRVTREKKEKKIGTHQVLMNHTKYLIDPVPISFEQKKIKYLNPGGL
jgi:polyphosphate kinase